MDEIKKYWTGLQPRERLVLAIGGIVVSLILMYALLVQPWHKALNHMEAALPGLRTNLIWMRQQSQAMKTGSIKQSAPKLQGQGQSLLSVVEQTAKRAKVSKAIQQMTPAQNSTEVRVVLDGVNFNQWLRWVDELYKRYGVDIKQVTAERDEDEPNIAEIRVTFIRSE
jgi:general secretion pathway protein M